MFRRGLLLIVLVGLSVAGCGGAGGLAPLSDTDRAAIEANRQKFLTAVRAADWPGLAATYTPDAVLMPPNTPAVEGRENIRSFFVSFSPISEFTLETVEIDGRGDIAFVRGRYSMTLTIPGVGPLHDSGKYLEIHLKQPDGSWPLHRDMFNSDVAVTQ